MKTIAYLAGMMSMLFCLSGCSSYYYSTLSSNDQYGGSDENNDFVQENDSVRISYCFYGENAPISISIYNKLEQPLFVDWQRSALIIDDVATSYYQGQVAIQGQTESSTSSGSYRWNRRYSSSGSYSQGAFTGEVQLPRGVEFIPPHSKVEASSLCLNNLSFDKIPKNEFAKQQFAKANSEVVQLRVKQYTEEDSPLFFRSYLSLYTVGQKEQDVRYFSFERSFYISELIKAGSLSPQNFVSGQRQDGNFFYVHKTKGAEAGLIIGAIAIGTAGIVLESALEPTYHHHYHY